MKIISFSGGEKADLHGGRSTFEEYFYYWWNKYEKQSYRAANLWSNHFSASIFDISSFLGMKVSNSIFTYRLAFSVLPITPLFSNQTTWWLHCWRQITVIPGMIIFCLTDMQILLPWWPIPASSLPVTLLCARMLREVGPTGSQQPDPPI